MKNQVVLSLECTEVLILRYFCVLIVGVYDGIGFIINRTRVSIIGRDPIAQDFG
jgi:hypothetical protein